MSYSVTFRIYQTNPNNFFHIVERTVWHYANGGTWTESNGEITLTMGGSGTSGILRFQSVDGKELFTVLAGVHNYKPWGDIATDLAPNQTASALNPEYYAGGPRSSLQLVTSQNVTSKTGRKISFNFTVAEGNKLSVNVIIG